MVKARRPRPKHHGGAHAFKEKADATDIAERVVPGDTEAAPCRVSTATIRWRRGRGGIEAGRRRRMSPVRNLQSKNFKAAVVCGHERLEEASRGGTLLEHDVGNLHRGDAHTFSGSHQRTLPSAASDWSVSKCYAQRYDKCLHIEDVVKVDG
jgi:hypothetical protein